MLAIGRAPQKQPETVNSDKIISDFSKLCSGNIVFFRNCFEKGSFLLYFGGFFIMDFLSGGFVVLLGNFISLLACVVMVLIGFIKNKEKILIAQCGQFVLMGASNFVLGGYGSVIANIISLARNVVFTKFKSTPMLKIFFIVLQLVLSIKTLSLNPISWIPFVAVAVFTWYIDTDDVIKFKAVMMGTVILWTAYDLSFKNYVLAASDVFTFISTGISIYQIKKAAKKEIPEEKE